MAATLFVPSSRALLMTQQFIANVVLQRYEPKHFKKWDLQKQTEFDTKLLHVQENLPKLLTGDGTVPEQSFDSNFGPDLQERWLNSLLRYASGQGGVQSNTLAALDYITAELGEPPVSSPPEMMQFLQRIKAMEEGDNPFRIAHGNVELPAAVYGEVPDHVNIPEGSDPYDQLRTVTEHNVYAIDSATTSEVDDAIGIHYDKDGKEWLTVYVSDATVHCPFGSELQDLSAKKLTTTTYLPEGVWFMLPREIVEAATLRSDKPCRTFEIRFRLDPETAQIFDYSVHVGWSAKLRRITYDAVQELYDRGPNATKPMSSSPSWCTEADVQLLHRIHALARIRLDRRLENPDGFQTRLPEPLISVKDRRVTSLKDQIIGTQDARIAVAELMIMANEACARLASEGQLAIPFRGSRPYSVVQEGGLENLTPPGIVDVTQPPTAAGSAADGGDKALSSEGQFAKTVYEDLQALRGVTRAIYSHKPLFHNGLLMDYYCHSTSPLRRYPDMLVHHQLKHLIGRAHGMYINEAIEPDELQKLASRCSSEGNRNRLMQKKSARFWALKFLQQELAADPTKLITVLVSHTVDVRLSLEHARHAGEGNVFESDVYIPHLQITHTIWHSNPAISAGQAVSCRVTQLIPEMLLFKLEVIEVMRSGCAVEEAMAAASVPLGASL